MFAPSNPARVVANGFPRIIDHRHVPRSLGAGGSSNTQTSFLNTGRIGCGCRPSLNSQLSTKNLRRRCAAFALETQRERASAFTLLELLIVVGIIGLLLVLLAPAFTTIKGGTDVTSAAYTIQGVLDTARTYAKANNTYTWVGFFEEDAPPQSGPVAVPGIGRVVMSIVASTGGTMLYTANLGSSVVLDASPTPSPAPLIQVGKLTKIDNVHLKAFSAPTGTPPTEFDTRPGVASTASQIGDTAPPNPSLTFHYPLGASPGQYTFTKIVQFSPRGEAVIDNSNYALASVSEIGLQPTHGTTVDTTSTNLVAIQFTGIDGNFKIYRK
jgi:type II secretory pathway pseudopilin PulG